MRILVVGAGATGGCFGARLAAAGRDVTFLVRGAAAARLRAAGLVLRGPAGDLRVRPAVTTAAELVGTWELVLLAVKAYSLPHALADLAPAVGPDTLVLPVLNGMGQLDALAERFGRHHALGGVCQVSSTVGADGVIHQFDDQAELVYGGAFAPEPAGVAQVHSGLAGAGFTARHSADIRQEMWDKWVYVAAIGAVTCLMRGPVGEVVAADGTWFAERVVAECAAVADACGHRIAPGGLDHVLATVTEPGSGRASSLYRDLIGGGPVEGDHVLGDLVALARRHGVDTPMLRLAHTHLSVHQNREGTADAARLVR